MSIDPNEIATDVAKDLTMDAVKQVPALLGFLLPDMKNKITKRKLANAISGIEEIKDDLAKMGVEVDYPRYFEEQLKIPVKLTEALSLEEEPPKRELLKTLFKKHLSEQYGDDSLYATFIQIIEGLSRVEVALLKAAHETLVYSRLWRTQNQQNFTFRFDREKLMLDLKIDDLILDASLKNLERYGLMTTIHANDSFSVDDARNAVIGSPALSPLGILFLQACLE